MGYTEPRSSASGSGLLRSLPVDDPIRGLVRGKEIVLRGCSLHWWKQQEGTNGEEIGDWRIVREGDYAVSAEPGGAH